MRTILILTVGGSHQPIVRSIQQNQPDFVHFLCSADRDRTKGSYTQVIGEGKVLKSAPQLDKPDLPNIVTLTGLSAEQYAVHQIEHFDDLNDCYLSALRLIERVHAEHPDAKIIADYTGGTKSMTAGLVAAALDDGRCEIQLVTGQRQDLRQVTDQTEFVRPVWVWDAQVQRRMRTAREFIAHFDYAGAARLLEDTVMRFASKSTLSTLQRCLSLCRAFDAWDRFDHETARRLLQPYRGQFVGHAIALDAILTGKGHGFEWVEDLLLNAERRAAQGRYDDAVGRLYRALELTAQVWLRQRYDLDTSNVDVARVPEAMRARLEKMRDEKGVVKIGLLLAWDVLAAFPDDPIGAAFAAQRGELLDFLSVRNESLFAHGQRPVSQQDYEAHAPRVTAFLHAVIKTACEQQKRRFNPLLQLPTELLIAPQPNASAP